MGMNERHAELAYFVTRFFSLMTGVPALFADNPAVEKITREKNDLEEKAAASTRVEFFTMVRGE